MSPLLWAWLSVPAAYMGGFAPLGRRFWGRDRMLHLSALRSGILLAVAFADILPEAWRTGAVGAGWGAVAAFAAFFTASRLTIFDTCPEYLEDCRTHSLGGTALAALLAHSLIDGFNLSMTFKADSRGGMAVGAALLIHRLADGFTMGSLLSERGFGEPFRSGSLLAIGLMTPLGSRLGIEGFGLPPGLLAPLLGFAAGSFVYIAADGVIPFIHRGKDKTGLAYFAAGIVLMAALTLF